MTRRVLDTLYAAGAALAALCLFSIFAVMILQVALREAGRQFPGADDLTAYLCVAMTFFALAATFRRGELVRVGLLLERLGPTSRRLAELVALGIAALLVGYVAWWTLQDTLFSLEIEEVAQGTVPFPLWLPKLAMPVGAGLLLLAILDELVGVARGRLPEYVRAAAERAAAGDFSAEV